MVYKVLPITNAEETHAILERGENIGKVVIFFQLAKAGGVNEFEIFDMTNSGI